jgi:hypothetical protein
MTLPTLKRAVYDKLAIAPHFDAGNLEVHLSGVCDSFAVKSLGTYLEEVGLELSRLALTKVAFDVTKLSLLNSSSLKQFITFLRPMKLGESNCTVEFVVDDAIPWQRRCMAALVRMCPNAVSLRAAAGGAPGRTSSRQLHYVRPQSVTPTPRRRP